MKMLIECLYLACAFYAVTFFMGLGIARILLKDDNDKAFYFAPRLGIAQTGFILIAAGWLDFGTNSTWWVAAGVSAAELGWSFHRKYPAIIFPNKILPASVILITVSLMLPIFVRGNKLTGFTAGNMDI